MLRHAAHESSFATSHLIFVIAQCNLRGNCAIYRTMSGPSAALACGSDRTSALTVGANQCRLTVGLDAEVHEEPMDGAPAPKVGPGWRRIMLEELGSRADVVKLPSGLVRQTFAGALGGRRPGAPRLRVGAR